MHDFIKVNGSVLDFEVYQEKMHYLKEDVLESITQALKKQGFQLQTSTNETYLNCSFSFYNNQLDVEIKMIVRKKGEEVWV